MRISDWSSDVCSSDLAAPAFKRDVEPEVRAERHLAQRGEGAAVGAVVVGEQQAGPACVADQFEQPAQALRVVQVGRGAAAGVEALRQDRTAQAPGPCAETERQSVEKGNSVAGRVDLGGRRSIKKK